MSSARPVLVVGYDGSALSRAALAHAATLTGAGRLVVVHVCPDAPEHAGRRAHELLQRDHRRRARALLDALLLDHGDELAGLDWERRLAHGDPAVRLVEVADEERADAIVVGSHGYGPVSALLGSVSHGLLGRSDRPVVVVPPRCAQRLAAAGGGGGERAAPLV